MSGQERRTLVEQFVVDGRRIECYGVAYSDTPAGTFNHYDLFEDGFCLHEADRPFYEQPTIADVQAAIEREGGH
jgi:hypothetical protein